MKKSSQNYYQQLNKFKLSFIYITIDRKTCSINSEVNMHRIFMSLYTFSSIFVWEKVSDVSILFVCPTDKPSVCLSIYQPDSSFFGLYVRLAVCPSAGLSVFLLVCQLACLCVSLSNTMYFKLCVATNWGRFLGYIPGYPIP